MGDRRGGETNRRAILQPWLLSIHHGKISDAACLGGVRRKWQSGPLAVPKGRLARANRSPGRKSFVP